MSHPPTPLSQTDRRAHEEQLLKTLAARVRYLRDMRGMSRKLFAEASRVSAPHIGRLEAGFGNVSVLVLDRLARALGTSLETMFSTEPDDASNERALIMEFVRKSPAEQLPALRRLLVEHLSTDVVRGQRIALLGIRCAGKTSVGEKLARRLRLPFVELDQVIQADARMDLDEIFAQYGQTGYRSLERRALERVLLEHPDLVLAAGGGIVTDPHSYELLTRTCHTVWLHARHDIYYERARTQGDDRLASPAIHRTAIARIRRTMAARHKLYAAAQLAIDSSDLTIEQVVRKIAAALKKNAALGRSVAAAGDHM